MTRLPLRHDLLYALSGEADVLRDLPCAHRGRSGADRVLARMAGVLGSARGPLVASLGLAQVLFGGHRFIEATASIFAASYYPVQGTKAKRFEQVGNAVPPLLAWHVLAAVALIGAEEVAA